jgi:hypothetical protein
MYNQDTRITVLQLPLAIRKIHLVAKFSLSVWKLALGEADAVSLNESYWLPVLLHRLVASEF